MRTICAVVVLTFLSCFQSHAQITWELINEYPANSITGEGDLYFAELVKEKTHGELIIIPIADAKSKVRTKDQLKSVADGHYAMADSLAGGLGEESPVFLLSSLPFVTSSPAEAQILFNIARPYYEKQFEKRKQKLLYISPWPPTGLWSSTRVRTPADLQVLKIRTYDLMSADVMRDVAASAEFISFSDLTPKLESGMITAVLSSGDGGAGRQLWQHLPYFTDIKYAIPLSFATVSLEQWDKLDEHTQHLVLEAAEETSAHQWAAMKTRVAENYKRMQDHKVEINSKPSARVMRVLHSATEKAVLDWKAKVGPEAASIIDNYHRALRRPPSSRRKN